MTKCAHCGQVANPSYDWTLTACADQRKQRKKKLCRNCDIHLNRIILAFFNDPAAEQKMEAYIVQVKANG